MDSSLVREIFLVLVAGLLGGVIARLIKLQPIVGYIVSGIIIGAFLPSQVVNVSRVAFLGAILLLFSNGIQMSLGRLKRILKVAVLGGILEITLSGVIFFALLQFLHFNLVTSFILACSFSLSSTALVIKILNDRGEIDAIHGELMIGWLLIQDVAVIPIMVIFAAIFGSEVVSFLGVVSSLFKAFGVIAIALFLGGIILPYLTHKVSLLNSRELLTIAGITFAIGTAILASAFGVSAALGAFLAGVVISHSHENHAIFAEVRPLRDIFVAIFFISLGLMVKPEILFSNIPLVILLVLSVTVVKILVFLFVNLIFGYHGKTAVLTSFGLANVGEFSFIIIAQALLLGTVDETTASLAVSVVLSTLIIAPFLFKLAIPAWRKLRERSQKMPFLEKLFVGWDKNTPDLTPELKDHVIICGFGRMGKWIAKALESIKVPYVVIDYNQYAVNEAKKSGIMAFYGDPAEERLLKDVAIDKAKAVVVALPDRLTQEELVALIQTQAPAVKIYSRAHFDEDIERLKSLRVDKVVQPEFEAAVAITKSMLLAMGKTKEEITSKIKALRQAKAMTK